MVNIETNISLGTLIHLVTLLMAVFACYFGLVRRLDRHEDAHKSAEHKIDLIWRWFKKVHNINGNSDKDEE